MPYGLPRSWCFDRPCCTGTGVGNTLESSPRHRELWVRLDFMQPSEEVTNTFSTAAVKAAPVPGITISSRAALHIPAPWLILPHPREPGLWVSHRDMGPS